MPSSKRVAVIGAHGQVGSELVAVFRERGYEVTPFGREDFDVTEAERVETALSASAFDVVVNTAAFHRVEACEADPETAFRVNALGAWNVAKASAAIGALTVYFSTDYVFSGERGGYGEDDAPNPVNVYGAAKAAGEMLVRQACPRHLVLRIASVFGKAGSSGKGGNFVETILGKVRAQGVAQVVADQWMSPTYAHDAADLVERLVAAGAQGTYHLANAGRCSWFELAAEAVRQAGLPGRVEPTSASSFPSSVRRPRDSSLVQEHLVSVLGYASRPWQEALHAYLVEKGHAAV